MAVTTSTAIGTAANLLALSKTAQRLEISLTNLELDASLADPFVRSLVEGIRSLGAACAKLYNKLDTLDDTYATVVPTSCARNDEIWDCLAVQARDVESTIQELGTVVEDLGEQNTDLVVWTQRLPGFVRCMARFEVVKNKIIRHNTVLIMTLLLINAIFAHPADRQDETSQISGIQQLQSVMNKLEGLLKSDVSSSLSPSEVTLLRYAREVVAIESRPCTYDSDRSAGSVATNQRATSDIKTSDTWIQALNTLRQGQRHLESLSMAAVASPCVSFHGKHSTMTSARDSTDVTNHPSNSAYEMATDFDDEFEIELARSALNTGSQAFEAQDWEEASSLLQEALRALLQLTERQRAFCDVFDLHVKLAICCHYTQDPWDAEKGLASLIDSSPTSDEQRKHQYHAMHLLSQLHVRTGEIDRAYTECERALQGRRRLSGKTSQDALESMALMAHIYVLLDNRARAKSCLAMIPEAQRNSILEIVEVSLGGIVQHLDFASLLTQPMCTTSDSIVIHGRKRFSTGSKDPNSTVKSEQRKFPVSPLGVYSENCSYAMVGAKRHSPSPRPRNYAPSASSPKSYSLNTLAMTPTEEVRLTWTTSLSLADSKNKVPNGERVDQATIMYLNVVTDLLSRKDILKRVGCQPRDRTEEAVCAGDVITLASLLMKRKSFWRSSLLRRGRSERVTALHFAALFGEIDMAKRLLDAQFDVNEIPFGYSTSLTPLHFAIGARQVLMVEFLLTHGARPSGPDTWSTLAGQLLSRAWLMKTMSEAERQFVPLRIIAILAILLRHGWNLNEPFGTSSGTILHQAVIFWTGSYNWDLELRAAVTLFLCEQGADPLRVNAEGKTPYDLALISGHQDLLQILGIQSGKKEPDAVSMELVELPGQMRHT